VRKSEKGYLCSLMMPELNCRAMTRLKDHSHSRDKPCPGITSITNADLDTLETELPGTGTELLLGLMNATEFLAPSFPSCK
jgi:hypothetical protein